MTDDAEKTLEERIKATETSIAELKKPFWKRATFWGTFSATLATLGIYLLVSWGGENTALPELVHEKLFYTEDALDSLIVRKSEKSKLRNRIHSILTANLNDSNALKKVVDGYSKFNVQKTTALQRCMPLNFCALRISAG